VNPVWPKVKLGEALKLDLERVPVDPSHTYPMVGVYSFGRGLFDREPIKVGKTSYRYFCRLKADHVVMSQLFGWEGALAISSEQYAGKFVSPQFPTFLCDNAKLDRMFLSWLMRRPAFWEDLGSRASGMGDRRRTLNPDALFASQIPLPPLDEQRRIVTRIEELAAKIAEARSLRDQSARAADALCRAILESDTSAPPTPMRELVTLRNPDVIVRPDETYEFAGVYCFGRGVFRGQRRAGIGFAYSRLTRLRTGNFVYPKLMAWEGALAVVPSECAGCVVSTEFPVFEANELRVLPEVLDTYFRNPAVWPSLAGASTGTNVRRRRLNPKDLLNYKMPLPSRATQERLREVRGKLDALKRLKAETSAELDALLPSILEKAFSGDL
jgi:type I restriction enzyme, S subunit